MSKPLELIIYPKSIGRYGEAVYTDADGEWAYREADCDRYAEARRLNDADLAAEYWRAKYTGLYAETHGGLSDTNREKVRTVERFYILPSYDEPQL